MFGLDIFGLYTELFWTKVGQIDLESAKYRLKSSDQLLLNYGLYYLKIHWQKHGREDDPYLEGECEVSGMRVTIIPEAKVCRFKCRPEIVDTVYIWHMLSQPNGKDKMVSAEENGLNFLSSPWSESSCHHTVGERWLQCISDGRFK